MNYKQREIDELEEEMNSITFGMTAADIGKDYDFFASTNPAERREAQGGFFGLGFNEGPSNARRGEFRQEAQMLTVEEIEAQMQAEARFQVEQDKRQEWLEQKRKERQKKAEEARNRREKYAGLMTRQDKEGMLKQQISQLVVEDSYADTFYSHMYKVLKYQRSGQTIEKEEVGRGGGRGGGRGPGRRMSRAEQELFRIVNEAKRKKPRATAMWKEGALGRIALVSSRTPRRLIQVEGGENETQKKGGGKRTAEAERRKTLQAVEHVYEQLLELEQVQREEVEGRERVEDGMERRNKCKEKMWQLTGVEEPVSDVYPHPFVRILSVDKGKRLVGRIAHQLNSDELLAMVTTIVANFETLDVHKADTCAVFMASVVPVVSLSLAETDDIDIVCGLLALLMNRNDISWVVRTRPGLAIVTLLLGRAHLLLSSSSPSFAELFALLFSSLKPSLPSLIPAPSSLPSPSSSLSTDPFEHSLIASFGLSSTTSSSSSKNNSSASSKLHLYADETMVWQFLASLAIVANIDQQHHLVSLTRLSITSRIRLAQSDPQLAPLLLHNVNLFLNALGLDASQLSSL